MEYDAYKLNNEFMWRTTTKKDKYSGDRNIWEKSDFLNSTDFIQDILDSVNNKDSKELNSDIIN